MQHKESVPGPSPRKVKEEEKKRESSRLPQKEEKKKERREERGVGTVCKQWSYLRQSFCRGTLYNRKVFLFFLSSFVQK